MSFRGRLCRPWESPGRVSPLLQRLCRRKIVPGDCHGPMGLAMTGFWCVALVGAVIHRPKASSSRRSLLRRDQGPALQRFRWCAALVGDGFPVPFAGGGTPPLQRGTIFHVGAGIDRLPCLPRFEGGGFAAWRRRRELTPPVELPKFGNSTAPSQRGGQDGVLLFYRRGGH